LADLVQDREPTGWSRRTVPSYRGYDSRNYGNYKPWFVSGVTYNYHGYRISVEYRVNMMAARRKTGTWLVVGISGACGMHHL
jgi:hypothetical protein